MTKFGPVEGVDPRDYAWLYLAAHRFDHVVVHQGTWTDPKYAAGNERLKTLLAEAKVDEDPDVAVFDRARLRPPARLTWLCAEGFRPGLAKAQSWSTGVLREARMAVANPMPDRAVVLTLVDASAFARRRVVRLLEGGREVARWVVEPGAGRTIETPPFLVGAGVREWKLVADGEDRPARYADRLDDARTPYAWRLDSVRVRLAAEGGRSTLTTKEVEER